MTNVWCKMVLSTWVAVSVGCFAGGVQAATTTEGRTVVVGVHESYPWSYSSPGNVVRGLEKEIIAAAFETQNITVEFKIMSYSRLVTEFQNKRLDFASPVAIEVPGAYYTDKYLPFQDVAVTLKTRALTIDKIADLSQKTVVAYQEANKVLGPEYAAAVANARYTEMANRGEQIRQLFDQRVDTVVGESRISHCLAETLFGPDQLKKHPIFSQISYGGATWDKRLQEQFQAGLKLIKHSGQYQKILARSCPAAP